MSNTIYARELSLLELEAVSGGADDGFVFDPDLGSWVISEGDGPGDIQVLIPNPEDWGLGGE